MIHVKSSTIVVNIIIINIVDRLLLSQMMLIALILYLYHHKFLKYKELISKGNVKLYELYNQRLKQNETNTIK